MKNIVKYGSITKEDKKSFLEKTEDLKLKILLPLGDFLKEKGCKDGDEVVIGDQRFTFQE